MNATTVSAPTIVGDAKLWQGDCLQIMPSLEDGSIDLILCDLPYGTTQNKWDSVIPLDKLWEQYMRLAKPDTPIVLTSAQPFTSILVNSALQAFKYEWIWEKSRVTGVLNAKKQPLRQHESVLVFYRKPGVYNPQGVVSCNRQTGTGVSKGKSSGNYGTINDTDTGKYTQTQTGYPRTVLRVASEGKTQHPTQKPVPLMEYLVRTYTNEGATVLDNCMGSGTTGVACKASSRKFIGIEQDQKYFDISVKRITDYTI